MLENIRSPKDIKNLSEAELEQLSVEIRKRIIATVSKNGGHLASNLGDVELTLALHRALNCPKDKIIFDVGHQCYTHKLITGRADAFDTLRQTDGLCGFTRRAESEYDCFDSGHASNAISAALGMARARDALGTDEKIAVVIGDGALTGGMAYEGLNDAGNSDTQLLVILNDNGMSISGNVGAINNYLTHMRLSKGWQNLKKGVSTFLYKMPVCGKTLHRGFKRIKNRIRNVFIHDKLFSALGFSYFGPIDGQDIKGLEKSIRRALELNERVLIHVYTRKGSGFAPAEDQPDAFHGTPPFSIEDGAPFKVGERDFGRTACEVLTEHAKADPAVTVVTAAMTLGTGMKPFADAFPKRIFDVGIAEEHAVTMSGGMALNGLKPFTAIYDSFLQRAYDQVIEDVCMQKAPVCLLCDRAGIGSADGASHHGVFGASALMSAPGMTVLQPVNRGELRQMLEEQLEHPCMMAIRYPKAEEKTLTEVKTRFEIGRWSCLREGTDAAIISYGNLLAECLKCAEQLAEKGISLRVINASTLKPLDETLLRKMDIPCFVAEEGIVSGGLASAIAAFAAQNACRAPSGISAVPDLFIPHGSHHELLKRAGLTAEQLGKRIAATLTKN